MKKEVFIIIGGIMFLAAVIAIPVFFLYQPFDDAKAIEKCMTFCQSHNLVVARYEQRLGNCSCAAANAISQEKPCKE